MLRQISDYLFMGSLTLLIITCFLQGVGLRGFTNMSNTDTMPGAATDLNMEHNHQDLMESQDTFLRRILRSYLFWLSIIGIGGSILLSKL